MTEEQFIKMWVKRGLIGLLVLVILCIGMCSFTIVPAGHRGVLMTWGKVDPEVYGEGLMWRIPIAQSVKKMDVQIQKSQTEAAAASKDLQETHSTIALNYHLLPSYANWVYQNVGVDYAARLIDPAVQEVTKAVTARYTAVDLIGKRETVSGEIKDHIKTRLAQYGIIVDDFSIVNFSFSKEFTSAIEAKQRAEQMAMKAKNDLVRVQVEAQQAIEKAKAEAESLRLQKANLSPELIKLRSIEAQVKAIEKWNGAMPYYTGGPLPFLKVQEP